MAATAHSGLFSLSLIFVAEGAAAVEGGYPVHPKVGATLCGLAGCLLGLGEYRAAQSLYTAAVAICRAVYGGWAEADPLFIRCTLGLGAVER